MKYFYLLLTFLIIFSTCWATENPRIPTYPQLIGTEEFEISDNAVYSNFNFGVDVGQKLTVGRTYFDAQSNGSVGRTIVCSDYEYSNNELTTVNWTKLYDSIYSFNKVYQNRIDCYPDYIHCSLDEGFQINNSLLAAFPTIAYNPSSLDSIPTQFGDTFPVFQAKLDEDSTLTSLIAAEFLLIPRIFLNLFLNNYNCYWPKAVMGPDGTIHIIATTKRETDTDEQTLYYYRIPACNYVTSEEIEPQIITTHAMNLSGDIALSEDGNMVVIGQTLSRDYLIHNLTSDQATQTNNDIYLFISYDGGSNFDDPLNITNFAEPDLSLLPDTTAANTDTMRAYSDMSIFVDPDDVIHLAFTAINFKYITAESRAQGYVMSNIYHWDNNSNVFCRAADGNFFRANPGAWQSTVSRPSMYKDEYRNILYIAFQKYGSPEDTVDFGDNGFPNSDIFITASCPAVEYSGKLWTMPLNITGTSINETGYAGDCYSERDVSLSLYNEGDYLNLSYITDLHSGSAVFDEEDAQWTNNLVYYHRVHKNFIEESAYSWLPNYPLHSDETNHWEDDLNYEFMPYGFRRLNSVNDSGNKLPQQFELEQNYPNPFNPSTKISFNLQNPGNVKLAVYDIQGREVASLLSQFMRSSHHELTFNGEDFASGIYFVRLEFNGQIQTRKMLLVR